MKNTIIVAIILGFGCNVFAQNPVISINRQNIIYQGIYNYITFNIQGEDCRKLIIKVDNGEIKHDSCGISLFPARIGTLKVSFFKEVESDTLLVGSRVLRVKWIPPPSARIYQMSNGEISADALSKARIESVWEDLMLCGVHPTIKKFKLIIYRNDEILVGFYSLKGNKLSKRAQQRVQSLKKGDVLYYFDIYAKTHYADSVLLNPIKFTVR